MPRQVPINPGFPTGQRPALDAQAREAQRRAARGYPPPFPGEIGHIERTTYHVDDGVNFGPADRIYAERRQRELVEAQRHANALAQNINWNDLRFDPSLYEAMTRGTPTVTIQSGKAPPLPKAQVTPQQMIAQVVKHAREQAEVSYVKRLSAEARMRDLTISEAEYKEAEREINRQLQRQLADTLARTAPPIEPRHYPFNGTVRGEVDVVVMSRQDLHRMIEGIGHRVLDEAKKNGFIR